MRRNGWIALAVLLLAFWLASQWLPSDDVRTLPSTDRPPVPVTLPQARAPAPSTPAQRPAAANAALLPAEALATLRRIHAGGPHPYRQDGTMFQNRERLLPREPRGWYREYTVDTPGLSHRGARRIVTGGDPPRAYWYTDDHYRSFTRFDPPAETLR